MLLKKINVESTLNSAALLFMLTALLTFQLTTALQVMTYDSAQHAGEIHTILTQNHLIEKPKAVVLPSSYLVGPFYKILEALNDGKHTGHVLYDPTAKTVAGFVVCSESHNRYTTDDKQKYWYIDWLAFNKNYQRKGGATQLWQQVICDATSKNLPIMFNTLTANTPMHEWCQKRELTFDGSKETFRYYSYRAHLSQLASVAPAGTHHAPPSPLDTPKKNKDSWLYRYRYHLGIGAGITASCVALAEWKYRWFTKGQATT